MMWCSTGDFVAELGGEGKGGGEGVVRGTRSRFAGCGRCMFFQVWELIVIRVLVVQQLRNRGRG